MEPVTLIIAALAAGAGLGLKDAASSAITDAYSALKTLVSRKLTGRQAGELVLAQHEQAPDVWEKPLAAELSAAGAADDQNLIRAAQAFLTLIDTAGASAGKYRVIVRDSQGVQIGDHNIQHVTFENRPDQ